MPRPRREGTFTYRHRPAATMWAAAFTSVALGVLVAGILWNEGVPLALGMGVLISPLPLLRLLFVRFEVWTADAAGLTIRSAMPLGWFARQEFFPAQEIRRVRYRIIIHEVRSGSYDTDEEWHHLELHMMHGPPSCIEILESRIIPLPPNLGRRIADHLGVEYVETHEPTL